MILKKLRKFFKVDNAFVCNSGTSALHLAFLASDIKKGDVVIMPAINFISAYSMCKLIGARIYLSDVDPKTGQMTPKLLLECIKRNKIKKIKAFITMYMGGFAENIIEFHRIKKDLIVCLLKMRAMLWSELYIQKKTNKSWSLQTF